MSDVDQTVNELTLASLKILVEAAKHGRNIVQIDCDPAKAFGLNTESGKFLVVVAGGQSREKIKAVLESMEIEH